MRDLISESFRRFNREYSLRAMTMRELDSHLCAFDSLKRDARRLTHEHLAHEVFAAQLPVATLCYLVLAANMDPPRKRIVCNDFPANDFQLACQLTKVVNTAVCIIHLSRDGYDTQARILTRTLNESIYQVLILFSSPKDYELYHRAESSEDTKRIWYELFGGKKRMFKKLMALEQSLGTSRLLSEEMQKWREERMDYYGEAVHHGVFSATWGSLARDFVEDQMHLAILGHASPSSKATLEHLQIQLCLFCKLFHELLLKIHSWTPDLSEPYLQKYLAMQTMLIDLRAENLSTYD